MFSALTRSGEGAFGWMMAYNESDVAAGAALPMCDTVIHMPAYIHDLLCVPQLLLTSLCLCVLC